VLLRRTAIVLTLTVLALILMSGCNMGSTPALPAGDGGTDAASVDAALQPIGESLKVRVNRDRDVLGLPALTASQALDAAARLRAEDMVIRGYLGAIGPGDPSVAAQELMAVAGYSGQLGELVYEHVGQLSTLTESTVGAWMASDVHRKLLLDTRFQFLGAGMAGGQEDWIVVVLFAEVGP
jgi:uncharacterized protein YkwD